MQKGRYYILEDGTRTFTRPSPLDTYVAYVVLCADPGYRLEHKTTRVVRYSITILEDYED